MRELVARTVRNKFTHSSGPTASERPGSPATWVLVEEVLVGRRDQHLVADLDPRIDPLPMRRIVRIDRVRRRRVA
jgi:hypothetical protein